MRASVFALPEFEIVTPELVPLRFQAAPLSARAMAIVCDFLYVLAGVVILGVWAIIVLVAVHAETVRALLAAFGLVVVFFLRNFYFIYFELRGGGVSPGKRHMGLRVIARDGGALTAGMVCARNFMREVELFLPVTFFLAVKLQPGAFPPWLVLATAVWLGLVLIVPFTNRLGLRLGDLAAGTVVVLAPRPRLLPDLSARARAENVAFSRAQLARFGVKQLDALEALLRLPAGEHRRRLAATVARKIARKLALPPDAGKSSPEELLRTFYRELRAELERSMLLSGRASPRGNGRPSGDSARGKVE